jgi:hypothetical protein
LPTNLATTVNSTVTAFAAIANGGTVDATGCGFAALPLEGDQTPGNFVYAQTDPTTNQVFGPANPLVTVPAGSFKTFVFALQPTLAYGFKNIRFVYGCANTAPASNIQGVNTFGLDASASPPSNILMVNATPDNDGFCHIQGTNGFCAFSVAATNLGVGGPITVAGAPLNPGTPLIVTTCETKPDGTCLQSPASQVMVPQWDQNQNRTFSVFVQGTDNVFSDPATNRANVTANDQQGNKVGGTGVATDTKVPPGTHTLLVTVSGQNGTAGTVKIDPPGKTLTFPDPSNPQNTVSAFEFYDTPTTVTLTATVTTGSSATFGGDCSGNGPSCTVTVGPKDRSVTVTFNK